MPGWAGSSWYLFRYMDPKNDKEFVSKKAQEYWQNVDLYIGGTEHATGHLMYSRFWTKFLYDRGFLTVDEPFKKLINQGMIQGRSNFVYRITFFYMRIYKKNLRKSKKNIYNYLKLPIYNNFIFASSLKNSRQCTQKNVAAFGLLIKSFLKLSRKKIEICI